MEIFNTERVLVKTLFSNGAHLTDEAAFDGTQSVDEAQSHTPQIKTNIITTSQGTKSYPREPIPAQNPYHSSTPETTRPRNLPIVPVLSSTHPPPSPDPQQQTTTTTSAKKSNPSKERRKFSRFLDKLGTDQLTQARQHVAGMQTSSKKLQSLLRDDIPYYEHITSDILTLFRGLLDKVILHGVHVAVVDDGLVISMRYKDQSSLSAADEKMVEAVEMVWKRFLGACCTLALAEAAWELRFGQSAVRDDVESEVVSVGDGDAAHSSCTPCVQSASTTSANDEAAVREPPPISTKPSVSVPPASPPPSLSPVSPAEEIDNLIARMDDMNIRWALYLATRHLDVGAAIRRPQSS